MQSVQENGKGDVVERIEIASGVDRHLKILGEAGQPGPFRRTADQRIVIAPVDDAQSMNQASNVSADPEVLTTPDVDDDVAAHPTPERRRASIGTTESGRQAHRPGSAPSRSPSRRRSGPALRRSARLPHAFPPL